MAELVESGEPGAGLLLLAATPIGNVDDATPRLRRALAEADVVAAEDTRRLRRLTVALQVEPSGRVLSYHEHNESRRTPQLVELLHQGATVVLVTDAGMPSVSDPGYRLVAAAVTAGVRVSALPGASAVPMALAVSGLPVDRFCFEGFLPRKSAERAAVLAALTDEPRTMVFFEAPHRLAASLTAMAEAFGQQRRAAVCRELTKTYEEVVRDGLAALAGWAGAHEVRGEVTVVVEGAPSSPAPEPQQLVAAVNRRAEAGERLKDVVTDVATTNGVQKRALYQAVLDSRR